MKRQNIAAFLSSGNEEYLVPAELLPVNLLRILPAEKMRAIGNEDHEPAGSLFNSQ